MNKAKHYLHFIILLSILVPLFVFGFTRTGWGFDLSLIVGGSAGFFFSIWILLIFIKSSKHKKEDKFKKRSKNSVGTIAGLNLLDWMVARVAAGCGIGIIILLIVFFVRPGTNMEALFPLSAIFIASLTYFLSMRVLGKKVKNLNRIMNGAYVIVMAIIIIFTVATGISKIISLSILLFGSLIFILASVWIAHSKEGIYKRGH